MQYLLMIYEAEEIWENSSEERRADIYRRHNKVRDQLIEDKAFVGGNRLMPTNSATTVKVRQNKKNITDGPFAETKEQLLGYYLIDCNNLDEAIDYAAQLPNADTGCIEIRPIYVYTTSNESTC